MGWRMGVEEEQQQQEQEEQHWTCRRCSQPPANTAALGGCWLAALRGRALNCIIILIVMQHHVALRGCWLAALGVGGRHPTA